MSLDTTDIPNRPKPFPPEIDQSRLPVDSHGCGSLVDLVSHLRPLLPGGCEWLGQGALDVIGEFPIGAGGIAEVWAGKMGSRKVAIKVYRCNSSSNCLPTYVVSGVYL